LCQAAQTPSAFSANLHAEWQATAHINVNAVYVHFTPAGFLKSTGAKGIDYVGIWTSYMF
jgi:hypothetical protein